VEQHGRCREVLCSPGNGIVKESFDIPAKRRVRKAYRRFLKCNRPKYISNVLCLSGYEAIEVKEVYDKLGISRSSIISCEINEENFFLLRIQGLGMRYYHGDIVDYLGKTNRKFDIINLDFCGTFNSRVLDAIGHIFRRNLLRENGILAYTVLARRENKEVKRILRMPLETDLNQEAINHLAVGQKNEAEKKEEERERLKKNKKIIYRDGMDRHILITALHGGNMEFCDNVEYGLRLSNISLKYTDESDRQKAYAEWDEMDKKFALSKGMIPVQIERYSYHSDNGSPMRTSFYVFTDIGAFYKKFRKYNDPPEWGDYIVNKIHCGKILPEVYKIHAPKNNKEEGDMPKKVAKKMDERTKRRIVKALRAGVSKDKIARIFGVTKMQVSALDAWKTMGKKY